LHISSSKPILQITNVDESVKINTVALLGSAIVSSSGSDLTHDGEAKDLYQNAIKKFNFDLRFEKVSLRSNLHGLHD